MNPEIILPRRGDRCAVSSGAYRKESNTVEGSPFLPRYSGSFDSLGHLLSAERLDTFIRAAQGGSEGALRLRNSLHSQLTKLTNQEDWWNAELLLYRDTKKMMQDAISSPTKKQSTKGQKMEPGHVVAEYGPSQNAP